MLQENLNLAAADWMNPPSDATSPITFRPVSPTREVLSPVQTLNQDSDMNLEPVCIMKTIIKQLLSLALLSTLNSQLSTCLAQGTAFTYQGRLTENGSPASGIYDLRFTIYDLGSGGSAVAGPLTSSPVAVSNGLFTVALDFGVDVFDGSERWLDIGVRSNGVGEFIPLDPRQQLTATPYAIAAGNVTGVVPSGGVAGTYSSVVTFGHAANQFAGSFTGNGGALTNINATTLNGSSLAGLWRTEGNSGTAAGVDFLGTTDDQPLEFKVNGQRVLRLAFHPNTYEFGSPSPSLIGGHPGNEVVPQVSGATIAGGGGSNWWGATQPHRVSGHFGTIGGGVGNEVQGDVGVIAGGERGFLGSNAYNAFIGGGAWNSIHAGDATISGGRFNVIQTNAYYATIPGGYGNTAAGAYSFAAGQSAQALHNGSFVWADGGGASFSSTAANQFCIRAAGGVGINCAPVATLHVESARATAIDNTASFSNPALGPNGSHVHWGASGDWYVRSASSSGKVILQDSGGNVGIGTATPLVPLHVAGNTRLAGNVQIGTDNGDYRQVRLGGGNSAGFLYGSFPALGDGIHMSYNHFYNAAGGGQVINTGGATSRITVGYGFVGLYIGGVNAAPITQRLLANSSGVTVNGTFNNSSDRNAKQNFAPVDPAQILEKVAQLPISQWSYKEDPATRHIGPVAQDFHSAFKIGTDDKHIAPLDEGGVALAAIQGLNHKVESGKQKAEMRMEKLEAENVALKARLAVLEQMMAKLNPKGE